MNLSTFQCIVGANPLVRIHAPINAEALATDLGRALSPDEGMILSTVDWTIVSDEELDPEIDCNLRGCMSADNRELESHPLRTGRWIISRKSSCAVGS